MLAEVSEDKATGDIAVIFAEVRDLWGVPYVSAIQRHLATRPGFLEWAWEAVGPAFRSGAAQQAGERAATGAVLAPLAPMSREVLAVWGVDDVGLATIRSTAEGFVRVAPINMMFAGLVKALLAGATLGGATSGASPIWSKPRPLPAPPAMVSPDKVHAATRGALMQLATPSDGKPFVPGLYRMLAHWPGYLAHLATVLPPRLSEPATIAVFDQIRARIDAAVPEVLATLPTRHAARPMPVQSEREHFLTIGGTYRKTSPELIVLGRLISEALPR
jgi:hypothetical protein